MEKEGNTSNYKKKEMRILQKLQKKPKKHDESETNQWTTKHRLPEDYIKQRLTSGKNRTNPNKRKSNFDISSEDEHSSSESESSDKEEEQIKLFKSKLKKTSSPENSDSDPSNNTSDCSSSESEEMTVQTVNRFKKSSIQIKKTQNNDLWKKMEDSDFSCDEEMMTQKGEMGSDNDETQCDQYAEIKKELAEMSFEQLQKLQDKMGLKSFNQLFHGKSKESSDKQKTRRKKFKRENKNRPMEISSKRPVSVIREKFPVKKNVHRDPRFDELSGEYNETFFKKAYSFVDDMKSKEKKEIMKLMKKEQDAEKKEHLKQLLRRMDQQELAAQKREKEKTRSSELKKKERESVKEGKNPYFLKKSDKRKIELAEKFKELKKSGKLENYLKKKRKKNASKEKKKLPFYMQ